MSEKQSTWVQPYVGPFTKDEALDIAEDLEKLPLIKCSMITARGDNREEWDVLIKFKI